MILLYDTNGTYITSLINQLPTKFLIDNVDDNKGSDYTRDIVVIIRGTRLFISRRFNGQKKAAQYPTFLPY